MSSLVLVHTESGKALEKDTVLVHPETRKAWRFLRIVEPGEHSKHKGYHMIAMVGFMGGRRVQQIFHPHVFGCVIQISEDVDNQVYYVHMALYWRGIKEQLLMPFWVGVVALVPLAMFEHFHMEEWLFKLL